MGEKHVPEEIGTNVGPPYDPRRGHPVPREAKSQQAQLHSGHKHGTNKGYKVPISEKSGDHE